MNRDEYAAKLKAQIDQWKLKRLQGASTDPWRDMMRGADAAVSEQKQ